MQVDVVVGREAEEEGDPQGIFHRQFLVPDALAESARRPEPGIRPQPVEQVEEVERGEDEDEVDDPCGQPDPEPRVMALFHHLRGVLYVFP